MICSSRHVQSHLDAKLRRTPTSKPCQESLHAVSCATSSVTKKQLKVSLFVPMLFISLLTWLVISDTSCPWAYRGAPLLRTVDDTIDPGGGILTSLGFPFFLVQNFICRMTFRYRELYFPPNGFPSKGFGKGATPSAASSVCGGVHHHLQLSVELGEGVRGLVGVIVSSRPHSFSGRFGLGFGIIQHGVLESGVMGGCPCRQGFI